MKARGGKSDYKSDTKEENPEPSGNLPMVFDLPKEGSNGGDAQTGAVPKVFSLAEKPISHRSKVSSCSSKSARRRRLELEAKEAKARIEMELIDHRLQAHLADIESEYSSQTDGENGINSQVENWLDSNEQELNKWQLPTNGSNSGKKPPPPTLDAAVPITSVTAQQSGNDYGTVQLLASAIKNLTVNNKEISNAQMLSRISTSKDLPLFSGDPMEWLYFKQAFEESTQVCHFTEKENLWRLRKCLQGAAKEAVLALMISATSASTIMSTLELQFGNPNIIISRIMQDINKQPPLPPDYHKYIVSFAVKIQNYVAAVSAIGQTEYLKGMSVVSIILSKMPTLLVTKWSDYSYPLNAMEDKPKLIILSEFLTEEAKKISTSAVHLFTVPRDVYFNKHFNRKQYEQTMLVQNDSNDESDKCSFCLLSNHILTDCKKFKKVLRKEKWNYVKRNQLCYKCLVSKHKRETCTAPVCDIENCGQSHHRLLHFPNKSAINVCVTHPPSSTSSESTKNNEIVTHIKIDNCKVLLKTVRINIHGPNGVTSAVALLDDGSTVSFISSSLASKIGLNGTKQTVRVQGAWDNIVCESEIVDFDVSTIDGHIFNIRARTSDVLNLPIQNASSSINLLNCDYINKIKHKLCVEQCKPDILIGQDNYNVILPLEILQGKPNEPYATKTPLGWCIHGPTRALQPARASSYSTLFIMDDPKIIQSSETEQTLQELCNDVRRSFTMESVGTGPDLLMSLYGIMLRFRENKIAVAADIKDMFLQVKILPRDQNALRFLWSDLRDKPDYQKSHENSVKTYSMKSLIFGANCSPFVAQFIKNKNAKRFESTLPEAVRAICTQHYMDDYIHSLPDEKIAIQIVSDIQYIHRQGGFEICNWMSNSEAVLNSLPKENLAPNALKFKIDNVSERTLGLLWYPQEDTLGFDVTLKRIPEYLLNGSRKPTKRDILRIIMSIFDIYGFLSPFTIKGKIILQQTWKYNLEWDDEVPTVIYDKWNEWLKQLKNIHAIRLPRYYRGHMHRTNSDSDSSVSHARLRSEIDQNENRFNYENNKYNNLQLHVFSDASKQAMCAVAYWRWTNEYGQIQLAFISSKCKVAPNKYMSMPRMELQAAVLAARLASTICKEHEICTQDRYFWCDSSTVLQWISNTTRNYKVFVAHRLGEIDELTEIREWRYVPTNKNVADIATRDVSNCDFSVFENEWFHGPGFLYENSECWPLNEYQKIPDECTEVINLHMDITVKEKYLPAVLDPDRFSSWLRLQRATCMVLMFIDKCKKLTSELDVCLMKRAETLLILFSQAESFPEDLKLLKNNRELQKNSRLLTLSPFLDDEGLLRVRGRIHNAPEVPTEIKYPVILEGSHQITQLIIRYYHVKFAHGNRETIVNEIKQKYWVLRLRPTVKHVISKCMLCRIKKAQPQPPRMGDLPLARMSHHQRPFTYCGLDLFGPMMVAVCRRREKRYGVLFTCLTVRAIHIEIVSNLSTDTLIMALRRMAARRGWPQQLFSDNGTNLRGANTELKRSIKEIDETALKLGAMQYGTEWNFIPPASPHWGGAWERMIRTVKNCLKVVLREHAPRDEALNTLMCEVEQMVNSRPLTHVTVEPQTNESLTPNHFLLGSSSNTPVIGSFDNSDLYLRRQWRISQRLADLFWQLLIY